MKDLRKGKLVAVTRKSHEAVKRLENAPVDDRKAKR